jgi:hypothetical protein
MLAPQPTNNIILSQGLEKGDGRAKENDYKP